jgi:hypothetical protein
MKHRPRLQTGLLQSPEAGFDDPSRFVAKSLIYTGLAVLPGGCPVCPQGENISGICE